MGTLDDSGAIFRYHRDMISMHGAKSSLALGWRDANDQQLRFDALLDIADLNGKTVLDAGCGYGDLYAFLSEHYILSHYYGVDQIPEILEEAIGRYWETEQTTFISRNFLTMELPITDYVLASGSLNYGSTDAAFIFKAINHLFKHCKLGLGFNLLRETVEGGFLAAYHPQIIVDHCKTLSSRVILKTDYAPEDFTIFMYKLS